MYIDLTPDEEKVIERYRRQKKLDEMRRVAYEKTPAGQKRKMKFAKFMKDNDIDVTKPGWYEKMIRASL